jgi:hypothetical protein
VWKKLHKTRENQGFVSIANDVSKESEYIYDVLGINAYLPLARAHNFTN